MIMFYRFHTAKLYPCHGNLVHTVWTTKSVMSFSSCSQFFLQTCSLSSQIISYLMDLTFLANQKSDHASPVSDLYRLPPQLAHETPKEQELQNWTGGNLNIIMLIGMNSRFAFICIKAQEQK